VFKTLSSNGSLLLFLLVTGQVASHAQDSSATELTGRWHVTRDVKNGGQEYSTLDLKQTGSEITGTYINSHGDEAAINDGKLNGQTLTLSFVYLGRHLELSGQVLSNTKIDLTIAAKSMNETFHAVAERKETPIAARTPMNALPLLPPRMTRKPLTAEDKLQLYIHQTFGPPAVILPVFGGALAMLNPPNRYPRDWKDGASAFGRNYGETVAAGTARKTAGMLAGIAFHEDPRYMPSTSSNVVLRIGHALAYTVVDRTDSGRKTIAFSNFAAAGAGGLVGMAYLPNGFNDATHAEQRILAQFSAVAVRNLAAEFQPQWAPIVRILRIPKLLPEWWVPLHPRP
jgi:hypothetical protein